MADEEAAHHLLNVIEERGIAVDLDSVLAAFEDDDTKKAVTAWTAEYLNEETLLTQDELQL
jgi:predicted HAD superfamily phosphohydrolase YqeG